MDPITRVYVDSNIFIYSFESSDSRAATLRSLFLAEQTTTQRFLTTSELTLAETLVGAFRRNDDELISLYDNWSMSNAAIEVGPVDRSILWRAAILRSRTSSVKLPDAIHLATAFAFNCSHFLSGDEKLGTRVDFVDPRPWTGNQPKTIQIIRPEQSSLDAILAAIN